MDNLGSTIFSNEPPIIEIRDEVAIIHHNGQLERAMSVRSFTRWIDRGQKALRRHAAGEAHVIVDD